jgi:magnesium chelatase family protein
MCRAMKESRDRVSTALTNSGFTILTGRITINLAPADVKKEGLSFHLPIDIGRLAGKDQLMSDQLGNLVVVGKLALTGSVSILKAKLPIAKLARVPDTIYDLERTSLTLWAPSV